MKILCVSDSHLENDILKNITNRYPTMDMYVHCGDSSLPIHNTLLTKYLVVKGNHDDADFQEEIIVTIKNYRFLIIHGNKWSVYQGYDELLAYMKSNSIDICFHGHSHVPTFYRQDNKTIINPGSTMINRASYGFGTYAIITIEDSIAVDFYHHITHQKCTKLALEDGKKTLDAFKQLLKKKR